MKSRFDLEQEILAAWNVTSDIKMITEEVIEGDLSRDQIANMLIGLEALYNIRFEKMFRTFEELIAERKIV